MESCGDWSKKTNEMNRERRGERAGPWTVPCAYHCRDKGAVTGVTAIKGGEKEKEKRKSHKDLEVKPGGNQSI